jgi:hypothetical protein
MAGGGDFPVDELNSFTAPTSVMQAHHPCFPTQKQQRASCLILRRRRALDESAKLKLLPSANSPVAYCERK